MKNLKITCKPFLMAMFIVLSACVSVQAMDKIYRALGCCTVVYEEDVRGQRLLEEKLFRAVVSGDFAGVQHLVDICGADVKSNVVYSYNDTREGNLFQIACLAGHVEIMDYLLKKGAPVETQHVKKNTLLQEAVIFGKLPVVKFCCERLGCDLRCTVNGRQFLGIAIAKGHYDVVKYLVEQGDDIQGDTGIAHVISALKNKSFDIAQYLIQQGVDFNARDRALDKKIWNNRFLFKDIQRLVEEFDLDVNTEINYHYTNSDVLKYFVTHGLDVQVLLRGALPDPSGFSTYLSHVKDYQDHGTVITCDVLVDGKKSDVVPNYFALALYAGQWEELKKLYTHECMVNTPEWLILPPYIQSIECSVVPLSMKKRVALEVLHELNLKYGSYEQQQVSKLSPCGACVFIQMMIHKQQKKNLLTDVQCSFN